LSIHFQNSKCGHTNKECQINGNQIKPKMHCHDFWTTNEIMWCSTLLLIKNIKISVNNIFHNKKLKTKKV